MQPQNYGSEHRESSSHLRQKPRSCPRPDSFFFEGQREGRASPTWFFISSWPLTARAVNKIFAQVHWLAFYIAKLKIAPQESATHASLRGSLPCQSLASSLASRRTSRCVACSCLKITPFLRFHNCQQQSRSRVMPQEHFSTLLIINGRVY